MSFSESVRARQALALDVERTVEVDADCARALFTTLLGADPALTQAMDAAFDARSTGPHVDFGHFLRPASGRGEPGDVATRKRFQ